MRRIFLFALCIAGAPALLQAQMRKLRIVSNDSAPIVYAYATIEGGTGQISDEHGEIMLGAGKKQIVTVNVRRLGYQQWFGKLELPDTAATLIVTLQRVAQSLGEIRVAGRAAPPPSLQGFYDRWLMRQKGVLSAVFIGPEELEFRHPSKITSVLSGLNGISFRRVMGQQIAVGLSGQCEIAIVVDGQRLCPAMGCKCDQCGGNMPSLGTRAAAGNQARISDSLSIVVPIDLMVDANSVAGIEVYGRGGNMPTSLQVADAGCGVIAIWTGSRKP